MYQPEHEQRKRARALLTRSGYRVGGHLAAHPDKKADERLIAKAIHEHERHDHRGESPTKLHFRDGGAAEGDGAAPRLDRRARGHAKGDRAKTEININVKGHPPEQGTEPVPPAPHAPMAAPVPPHPPMPLRPGMIPPMRAGMMPPTPMPAPAPAAPHPAMMAPRPPVLKRGGGVGSGRVSLRAGSGSGEGRLEKSRALPRPRH